MLTVTIGTPHGRDLTPEYVNSLFRSIGNGSGIGYKLNLQEGLYVHHSRNILLRNLDTDYLIFIDSDMRFKPGSIEKLIKLDSPVAAGVYLRRLPPYFPFAFMFDENLKPLVVDPLPDVPFKCDAVATGFMLIRRDLAEQMTKEYRNPFDFVDLEWLDPPNCFLGEDMAFCMRLKERGVSIAADPTLELGHVGHRALVLNQVAVANSPYIDMQGSPVA